MIKNVPLGTLRYTDYCGVSGHSSLRDIHQLIIGNVAINRNGFSTYRGMEAIFFGGKTCIIRTKV